MDIWSAFSKGDEFANYFYLKHQFAFKVVKWLLILLVCVSLVLILKSCTSASAYSGGTYSDLFGNNNVVSNLTSLIPSDNKKYDYIVFTSADNSYYLYYGNDFEIINSSVKATNCDFIRYYRPTNLGSFTYTFGNDNLNLSVNNIVSSNLDLQKSSKSWNFENYTNQRLIFILCLVFLPILLFANLWGVVKREFV